MDLAGRQGISFEGAECVCDVVRGVGWTKQERAQNA